MTRSPAPATSRTSRTAGALALVLASGVAVVALGVAAPAQAASRVTVTNDRGGADADETYRTAMTVTGTGFQSVEGGFGGVYVMFGWVDDARGGTWRPSRGGLTGQDYRYVPDAEDASDNQGYLRFVAFPGSSTAGEANAVLTGAGRFTVDLTVPGPVFESVDRDGQVARVDCRTATCGVITIGAHGVTNARNETFTRVRFGDVYGGEPSEAAQSDPSAAASAAPGVPGTTTGPAPDPTAADPGTGTATPAAPAEPDPAAAGGPVLTTDRTTAVAGHALAFTGRGFTAGEQVLAVLDDGVAALGPMVAGASGEVAGLLPLPADVAVGTHELRLTGAASGAVVSENFPVRGATTAGAVASEAAPGPVGPAQVFLAVAALLLVLALADLLRRRGRTRSARTTAPLAPEVPA